MNPHWIKHNIVTISLKAFKNGSENKALHSKLPNELIRKRTEITCCNTGHPH